MRLGGAVVLALGLALPAFADTYNFHFEKPPGENTTVNVPAKKPEPATWDPNAASASTAEAATVRADEEKRTGAMFGVATGAIFGWAADGFVALQIGYRMAPTVTFSAYLGHRFLYSPNLFFGVDAEWMPLQINIGGRDVFELGPIAGIVAPGRNSDVLISLGLRTNFNFTRTFGLTTAARLSPAGSGDAIGEAGIRIRI